jgi:hypothetical protein
MLASLVFAIFHTQALSRHWTVFGIDIVAGTYADFFVSVPVLVRCMAMLVEEGWKDGARWERQTFNM